KEDKEDKHDNDNDNDSSEHNEEEEEEEEEEEDDDDNKESGSDSDALSDAPNGKTKFRSIAPAPTASTAGATDEPLTVVPQPSGTRRSRRRRQPPHYREIKTRVLSIADKFLPLLGDIALANVGQLEIDQLSQKFYAVYGELNLLRKFLEQGPDESGSNYISTVNSKNTEVNANYYLTPTGRLKRALTGIKPESFVNGGDKEEGHITKRTKTKPEVNEGTEGTYMENAEANANDNSPAPVPVIPELDSTFPVVSNFRALPYSDKPSHENGVVLLNERRRAKLWANMHSEIFAFAVGYNSQKLREAQGFFELAYSQDGRMKRTTKNDLAIADTFSHGIALFRKQLYETVETATSAEDPRALRDCGIKTYTNNLYRLKTKPPNFYHYLFAAAFWRWVRDEIDNKTVIATTSESASSATGDQNKLVVNTINDWWSECVSLCNGMIKTHSEKAEMKAFLKDILIADEQKY
ncbi:hypothetical protein V1514DRAFT_269902, partial [Lipomyces japonicus]|uniref:uncharacterized protein n=1 Tax=Lipomyces japonicus TaxID=56871 RepID=UPI0034CFE056